MIRNIFRLAWHHAWRKPFQSTFFIIGVALGVAIILAIDLANESVKKAFIYSTESVAGKITHQIVGGTNGLDQEIYLRIRRDLGYRLSTPIIEEYVIAKDLDKQPMKLVGVDLLSASAFNNPSGVDLMREVDLSTFMIRPNMVIISKDLADRYNLGINDTFYIDFSGRSQKLVVIHLLATTNETGSAFDDLLITDIATAQEILSKTGRIDRIDLIISDLNSKSYVIEQIKNILPIDARLEHQSEKIGSMREMVSAFQLNLTALSLLALVVGMFLIYNTVTFSVVQRRPTIATLRAIGTTRNEVFIMILVEAIILGGLGTASGLGLGILLGQGTVEMMSRTINDVFFVTNVRTIEITWYVLIKSSLIGLLASMFAALIPSYEATHVSPANALRRSNIEEKTRMALTWVSIIGTLILVLGGILMIPSWNLAITFSGVFMVLVGFSLLTPLTTLIIMRLAQQVLKRGFGLVGSMAVRDITRSLSRTSVAITSLMVAVSVIIGVGLMTSSFRLTVAKWLEDLLQADVFISTPRVASSMTSLIDPKLIDQVQKVPGIKQILTNRGITVDADNIGIVQLQAVSADVAGNKRRYKSALGNVNDTWRMVESGGIVINEPLSVRFDIKVGDQIKLFTDKGRHSFEIVAVAYDFDVRPSVTMFDGTYRLFWDDRNISSIALITDPKMQINEIINRLRHQLAGKDQVIIQSNRALRQNAMLVFDRTFTLTIALQVLSMIVAFIGILSTLMSLQLERRKEIGLLRALGVTGRQLWKLILLETGLMGASAGLIAIPVGSVLAVILIYIINLRSFGWTLQMHLQATEFLKAFAVAVGSALVAGMYPAWQLSRIPAIDALRSE